jgi:putative chitinase
MELNRNLCPEIFNSNIFVSKPGAEPARVVAHSHYFDPLQGAGGNSRRWGDASRGVQSRVVAEILTQGAKLPRSDLAFALAVAKVESGFNPDAAAGTSSASGIGQFIDKTGKAFGLDDSNRFEIKANIKAFLTHLKENLSLARASRSEEHSVYQLAYALHHDGPSLSYGGAEIAKKRVLPELEKMEKFLNCR